MADFFPEARDCVAKGQRNNRDSKGFSKVEPRRLDNKPENKCRICGEPHLSTIDNYRGRGYGKGNNRGQGRRRWK